MIVLIPYETPIEISSIVEEVLLSIDNISVKFEKMEIILEKKDCEIIVFEDLYRNPLF